MDGHLLTCAAQPAQSLMHGDAGAIFAGTEHRLPCQVPDAHPATPLQGLADQLEYSGHPRPELQSGARAMPIARCEPPQIDLIDFHDG